MSFREGLSTAIAMTFFLVIYQEVLSGKAESFPRTLMNSFPAVSLSTIAS